VAINEPAIPSKVVTIKPMFSLPGMMSFAITPTINPTMMVTKRPNILSSVNTELSGR
jgi:hypothetical protein